MMTDASSSPQQSSVGNDLFWWVQELYYKLDVIFLVLLKLEVK
jgi:hypothetical protein